MWYQLHLVAFGGSEAPRVVLLTNDADNRNKAKEMDIPAFTGNIDIPTFTGNIDIPTFTGNIHACHAKTLSDMQLPNYILIHFHSPVTLTCITNIHFFSPKLHFLEAVLMYYVMLQYTSTCGAWRAVTTSWTASVWTPAR